MAGIRYPQRHNFLRADWNEIAETRIIACTSKGKAGGLRWPKLDENGFLPIPCKSLKRNGGDDGTRTRGLCRDRAAF
jgi:hypothetical protein